MDHLYLYIQSTSLYQIVEDLMDQPWIKKFDLQGGYDGERSLQFQWQIDQSQQHTVQRLEKVIQT